MCVEKDVRSERRPRREIELIDMTRQAQTEAYFNAMNAESREAETLGREIRETPDSNNK